MYISLYIYICVCVCVCVCAGSAVRRAWGPDPGGVC